MRQIDLNADLPCLYFVLVLHEFLSDKEYQPDLRFRRRNVNALPEGDGILVVGFFFFFFHFAFCDIHIWPLDLLLCMKN